MTKLDIEALQTAVRVQPKPSMNTKVSQDQEGAEEDLPASISQNRSHSKYKQTKEQATKQSICQPTLRDTWSPN